MRAQHIAAFVMLLLTPATVTGQVTESGFLDRTVIVEGTTYEYQVYVPRDYDARRDWPAILFLHGAGERGDDGLKQTDVGLGRAIRLNPNRWPAIAIFPQAPAGQAWRDGPADSAMAALDRTLAEFSIDESRVYLTGLSMGGNGTWNLGYQYPDRFAALVAVCGFVSSTGRFGSIVPESVADPHAAVAERIAGLPVWIFHGGADTVVPVVESRKMAEALQLAGADVQYTEFEGVNHNSWDRAYALESLPQWLFQQRRAPGDRPGHRK